MTLIILDNAAIAMTGGQPPLVPSSRLEKIVLGLGVDPEHLKIITALPREADRNAEIIRSEIHHHGLSVVIAIRECLETVKKKKSKT
jgi:indolepyruvate ferredoxin oxidoreductase, alpha subunit